MTHEEALALEQTLRAEVAHTPTLSFITVAQVTDNDVDSRDPCRWSVQLLNGHNGNLPIYVRGLGHWRAEIKPQLLQLAADD